MRASSAPKIQVRNVPASVHRELVRRAKRRGVTLTQYIEALLERDVARPLPEDVYARIAAREPVALTDSVALLREARAEREAEVEQVGGRPHSMRSTRSKRSRP